VMHWDFGVEATIPELMAYADDHALPEHHGFHIQTYFTTHEVKLRGGQALKIIDRGHLLLLDDPEVKALASRYADPGDLLSEACVPGIPGINMPGEYERDCAGDPLTYWKRVTTNGSHTY
jgi:hypothetical protein